MLNLKNKILNLLCKRKRNYLQSYYEERRSQHFSITSYLSLFEICKNRNSVKTNKKINYDIELGFRTSLSDAKRKIPFFKEVQINSNLQALYFRTTIGGYKARVNLRFYKRNLVVFSYVFSQVNDKDKLNILEIIKDKYLNPSSPINLSRQSIIDCNNDYIVVENGIYFIVNYVSPRNDLYNYLKQLINDEKSKYIEKKDSELLDLWSRL